MVNFLRKSTLALKLFRDQYGVKADPERNLEQWNECLWWAEEYLEEEMNGNE